MKVQKTPGRFSHKKNPLTVVDKNGDDTGMELTGGELVFNKEQGASINKMIASGDTEGLYAYMKDLLNKPQFNK